jgi:signal transduction histidine kinase
MTEFRSLPPTRTESYQWFILTVIYALSGVSAVRGLVVYADLWQALLMVLLPLGLVMAFERRILGYGRAVRRLYILVQLGLVAMLYVLARYADFWSLLLLPACYVAPRLFEGKESYTVITVIIATMFVCLWFAEGGVSSILFSSIYFVAFVMVYAFSRIIMQLEQARWDAEILSERLSSANQRLREYAEESADNATTEARHAVARDLHDSVTQTLFSLNLKLSTLLTNPQVLTDAQRVELESLQSLSESAMKELRGIISHLRPGKPPTIPFKAQLNAVISDVQNRSSLNVNLMEDEHFSLPVYAINGVVRIIRETLLNVMKHAQTRTVQLQLMRSDGCLLVKVSDNGVGFDLTAANNVGHMGLDAMQQHSLELGGHLSIHSQPGQGTELLLTLPINREASLPS